MLPQRRDVVQRQVAGGVAPAVTHLVVIDAEVIAQVAAEGVHAGLTDIFAARAQDGAQRLALDHQLQQQLAQAEIQLCAVGQGNGERLAERGVGQADQLLAGLFADAGVTFALLQLDLPNAKLAAVQPDKGAADPLIVPGALAAGEMNIERDAHAVLQRLAEGLRNNHPANLLRACGSSADVGLNEQKDHAEGKPRFQSWGNPSLRHRRYPSAQLSISREQTAHPAKAPPVLFYPPCPRA